MERKVNLRFDDRIIRDNGIDEILLFVDNLFCIEKGIKCIIYFVFWIWFR